ncbi:MULTISPECIES: FBP domain-containing protein [Microbacterium]|uniref:FBP domain-containing protein n=1 Tax=Microbacterium wangchenii TaxID=2541726 RepID=A0ABX5SQT3_9MICO|nr:MULTISPECIES: FBP domain-containing protein [Microbacterium]MCK6065043.1 FBP domain-containing protein [Microbacterium sp. EYE_512]QBR88511.1 FBP domain-containing protein [Microbacterium wangchenii]TFV82434.1 FBP domain-containing protein [Microbacterium sp. dk485]TXK20238.1 FBP domain-containing protein [Microbacterium wangchenii]
MLPVSDAHIRASFLNASRSERKNLSLPAGFDTLEWDKLDYLGWRDPRLPLLGYVLVELDGELAGVLLRQAEARPRSRAQCAWCADVQLPNDVVFFSARRSGDAGRRGDTVGTLVCEHFECSRNVRKLPPVAYLGFDVEAARQRRIEALRENVGGFVRSIRDGT